VHVARIRKERNAYRILVGKPERKRQLERPRHRWVDNIRMDLGEVGWDDVDWIGLAQDRNRWRKKKLHGLESTSELHRPSDRRLSAK
jgi:hypothetical protein